MTDHAHHRGHDPHASAPSADPGQSADTVAAGGFDATLRARVAALPPAAMDPAFRDALRDQLRQTIITTSASATRRRHWSRRRTFTLSAVVALGLAGGGAAVASGILPLPGAEQVVLRTPARTVVHTGTTTVDLGDRPDGVTSVELTLTCLSPGTLHFEDGANMSCSPQDVAPSEGATPTPGQPAPRGSSAGYTLPLTEGETSTTITATDGTRWSLTTAYSTRTPTDWATNANGETYGVVKDGGGQHVGDGGVEPDLIAVIAVTRTGEQGYVRASDLNPPLDFTSPEEALQWQASQPSPNILPVYAADGATVIGQFQVG